MDAAVRASVPAAPRLRRPGAACAPAPCRGGAVRRREPPPRRSELGAPIPHATPSPAGRLWKARRRVVLRLTLTLTAGSADMDQWLTSYPRRHALNVRKPRPWVQGPEHSSGRVERFLQVRRPQRPVAPRPCITSTLHRPFVCTAGPGPADGIVVRLCVCMCGRGGGGGRRGGAAGRGRGPVHDAGHRRVQVDERRPPGRPDADHQLGGGQLHHTRQLLSRAAAPGAPRAAPPAPAPTCLCEAILRELS